MFCASCGTQLPENAIICPNCQNKIEIEELNFQQANYGQQVKPNMNTVNSSNQYSQMSCQQKGNRIKDVREIFIRQDEQEKAVIGGGYLNNLLHTGILNKGFGVLTNRRFYFKGKCYHRSGNGLIKTEEERIIDLQDITSSGFTYSRNIWFFLLSLFGLLWAFFESIIFLVEGASGATFTSVIFSRWVPDIILWVIYILSKSVIYEISFAGGSIALKASTYSKMELRDFDKKLRLEKDEFLEKN